MVEERKNALAESEPGEEAVPVAFGWCHWLVVDEDVFDGLLACFLVGFGGDLQVCHADDGILETRACHLCYSDRDMGDDMLNSRILCARLSYLLKYILGSIMDLALGQP